MFASANEAKAQPMKECSSVVKMLTGYVYQVYPMLVLMRIIAMQPDPSTPNVIAELSA